ncbi:MAG: PKD domain-containing protein, partial [Bacteroidales bacterium]|nr:PKD domain-containing protein [Bacteroidales bacterium]
MKKFVLVFITILSSLTAFSQCDVTANFTYSSTGCRILHFSDSSYYATGYSITNAVWYFGDGDSATGLSATHYYSNTIKSLSVDVKYKVTVKNIYGDSCTNTFTKTIPLRTLPVVNITSDPNPPVCLSDTVQFYGLTSPSVASWQWDFGDAVSSNVQNPLHHFADTGTYNVTLFVTDSSGCSNQSIYPFKVESPTVDFSVSSNPASILDTLQFNGTSGVNILSWSWNFADGATSSVQNPLHTFSTKGDYAVTLSALTDNLCTPTVTHTVSIQSLPVANFTYSGRCLGDPITFTDASSSPNGIKKWVWYYGDGDSTVLRISDVSVTHPSVNHTYITSGTYYVTLKVTDANGDERSKTKNVVIDAKPQADFSITQACLQDTTFFQDQTVGTVNSWKWNFGDGHTSIAQDTANKYVTPGSYSVKLVVMNTDGCSDSIVKNVVIDSLPTVQISMAKNKLCFGEQEQFYGNSQDTVTWHWDFGNGDTSAYQNPLPYTYPGIGTYQVTLKVTDINGCQSSASDTVVVMDHPQADFSFSSQRCVNDSISFVDKTTSSFGILTSFNWSFGDPTSTANNSSQQNPKHYFSGGP